MKSDWQPCHPYFAVVAMAICMAETFSLAKSVIVSSGPLSSITATWPATTASHGTSSNSKPSSKPVLYRSLSREHDGLCDSSRAGDPRSRHGRSDLRSMATRIQWERADERLKSIVVQIRGLAYRHLSPHGRNSDWLKEYNLTLALYGLNAIRFKNLSLAKLRVAYLCAGIAADGFCEVSGVSR